MTEPADDWQEPSPGPVCDGPCCGGSVPMSGDWDYEIAEEGDHAMTEPTDTDRAKADIEAAHLAMGYPSNAPRTYTLVEYGRVHGVARALAAERAAAVADLRARVEAVAEEWEANGGWDLDYAARLRAAITDTTGDPA